MFNFVEIFGILIVHWVADFLLQNDMMANNKGRSNYWLGVHVSVNTSVWFVFIFVIFGLKDAALFALINFVCHFLIDYVTSRITGYFYMKKKWREFFNTIGIDQILHYVQIFLTYDYLR